MSHKNILENQSSLIPRQSKFKTITESTQSKKSTKDLNHRLLDDHTETEHTDILSLIIYHPSVKPKKYINVLTNAYNVNENVFILALRQTCGQISNIDGNVGAVWIVFLLNVKPGHSTLPKAFLWTAEIKSSLNEVAVEGVVEGVLCNPMNGIAHYKTIISIEIQHHTVTCQQKLFNAW